ncbi:hypothetical protein LG047_09045 [Methylocystis sp. WRRC1]|uniref:hypothetical protein n=1 Tax=Methylocystis sp. WRRC1 TaxID=1732014 RepID=UPI001D13F8F7|nr:hypothetical protein [Methylocystis sp. WRRC1]MCC3245465.1 hypothetical protein [Methylocystis sp. WRRC1]
MRKATTSPLALASAAEMTTAVEPAWEGLGKSFEQFCLIAGLASMTQMLDEDANALTGEQQAIFTRLRRWRGDGRSFLRHRCVRHFAPSPP